MRKWLCLACFFLSVLAWKIDDYRQVELKSWNLSIRKKDKRQIEYLFRELIVYNCIGYTLLGDKPISFDSFLKPHLKWDFSFLWHAFSPSNLRKWNAWKTWQKYEHLFCQGQFVIWSEPSPWIQEGELIVVAKKSQLARMLQPQAEDSKSLSNLKAVSLFKQILQSDDALIGTALGYGQNNAQHFSEINKPLLKGIFSAEIDSLFENKKAALNFTFGWPNVKLSDILMYPTFMAEIDSEESKQLKEEYLQTRQKILEYYENKDFFDATLQLFY